LDAGNKLGSTVDMMVGENPGQNQPATTTMAVLQQGLKVFIAIHKRMFKAFKEEYQKLYRLNKKHVSVEDYISFVDPGAEEASEAETDYSGPSNDVRPNADANVITEMQRVQKAQALLQLLPLGLNHEEVTRRVLVSQKQEDIDSLMKPNPNPPQDPKITLQAQKQHTDMLLKAAELVLKHMTAEAGANLEAAQALDFISHARLNTAQANSLDENVDLSKVDRHLEMIKIAQEKEEKEEEEEVSEELGTSND
jgi:chaperonin GroES